MASGVAVGLSFPAITVSTAGGTWARCGVCAPSIAAVTVDRLAFGPSSTTVIVSPLSPVPRFGGVMTVAPSTD